MGTNKSALSAKQRGQDFLRNDRAVEVLDYALEGLTWRQIAETTGVSYETVRKDIIKANKAALEKRDDLAQRNLAIMTATLEENLNILNSVIQDIELEKTESKTLSPDKKAKLEKRQLLAMDRVDKLIHRQATLLGMTDQRAAGVTIQGVASITIQLPGGPLPATTEEPPTIPGTLVHSDDSE